MIDSDSDLREKVDKAYRAFKEKGDKSLLQSAGIQVHLVDTEHDSIDFVLSQLGLPAQADSLKKLCQNVENAKTHPDVYDLVIYIARNRKKTQEIPFTHVGIYDGAKVHTVWEPGYVAVHDVRAVPSGFGDLILIRELSKTYRDRIQPQCYE